MSSWKANCSRWSVTISRVAAIGSPVVGAGGAGASRMAQSGRTSNSESDYRDYRPMRQRGPGPVRAGTMRYVHTEDPGPALTQPSTDVPPGPPAARDMAWIPG